MKTLLILGAGIMQIPALQAAREMGLRVIAADGNPQAPGASLADLFLPIDLKNREALLEAARKQKKTGLDGVFTGGTDFSAAAAAIAEDLGLPGTSYESALRASDKLLMRRTFLAHGVPQPRFNRLLEGSNPLEILAPGWAGPPRPAGAALGLDRGLFFPLVVKPVDNMGARGIRRVDTPEELIAACDQAAGFSRSPKLIIEEYIPGPEYSIDALVEDGEITPCGFADRHIYFEPYFVELGHTMPTALPPARQEEVLEVFRRGVRALGLTRGAAKGDLKWGPQGPVVGEIAARLSGGFMSGWTFPYASGINLTRAAINLALGLKPGNLKPVREQSSAERAFISLPGELAGITGLETAQSLPGIRFSHLRVKLGDRVTFPRNNVEKAGNFISQAPRREEAVSAAEAACRTVELRLKPSDNETGEFLLSWSFTFVPPAYTLENRENRAFLEGLRSRSPAPPLPGVLRLAPLPRPEGETGKDWLGLGFAEALSRVLTRTGAVWGKGEAWDLGAPFWRAFLRGGSQGGIWIIETYAEALGQNRGREFLDRWNS
ncbi:MAG: ATP-grasp domain-containing protein [Spirochaetales bacterium]|jgi:biotin carboxylase|nr:ATP-grasp domain-containing protein [Spirochaetales bacterium]